MSVPSWAKPYIEQMNNTGFWWKYINSFNLSGHSGYYVSIPSNKRTFFTNFGIKQDDNNTNGCYVIEEKITIPIITTSTSASFSFSNYRYAIEMNWENGGHSYAQVSKFSKSNGSFYFSPVGQTLSHQERVALNESHSEANVESLLSWLAFRYRNVNITVDGEDWTNSYEWESVPSISGNDKVIMLSTLNDINNGELVETTDITKINLNNNSNVHNIVRDIINNW